VQLVFQQLTCQRHSDTCACVCVCAADEQKELARSDVNALRVAVTQETFEKDTLQQSCADLRAQLKKLDSEKAELSRVVQDAKQKVSGTPLRCSVCMHLLFRALSNLLTQRVTTTLGSLLHVC